MSKPIFIVRFPKQTKVEELQNAAEHMGRNGFYQDYHVLVIRDEFTGGEIKFECFNSPHTEIEFKELQNRVLTLLKDTHKEDIIKAFKNGTLQPHAPLTASEEYYNRNYNQNK